MNTRDNTEASNFFVPENYREPSSSDNYMKLKQGDNKIRIMSSLVMGWEDWTIGENPKPVRFKYDQKPEKPNDPKRPIKLFWAFVVWNYAESKLQVLHVTQASIRRPILKICQDKDWGSPLNYDLKISRSGEELKTEYAVVPSPHAPVPPMAKKAMAQTKVDLNALFENKDPFDTSYAKFAEFTPKAV